MTSINQHHLVSLCGLLFLLAGCQHTVYDYVTPKSDAGKKCVARCHIQKQKCEQRKEEEKRRCESDAQFNYELCVRRQKADRCTRNSCYIDRSSCQTNYHECFKLCGGVVTARQVETDWLGNPVSTQQQMLSDGDVLEPADG